MAFLHMYACFNVPGTFGPGVALCTVVPRDIHFKNKQKKTFPNSVLLGKSAFLNYFKSTANKTEYIVQ